MCTKYHGKFKDFAERLGYEVKYTEINTWKDPENVKKEVFDIAKKIGYFPSPSDLSENHGGLFVVIHRNYGGAKNYLETVVEKAKKEGIKELSDKETLIKAIMPFFKNKSSPPGYMTAGKYRRHYKLMNQHHGGVLKFFDEMKSRGII